jgi:dTDP-4-dehydrorhamnose 3,5-epimerase
MNVLPTSLAGVLILEPKVFGDARGYFMESFNERALRAVGIDAHFVQDNQSRSAHNVLRGLHYQIVQPQGKIVRAVSGRIFDVAVDLRRGSATFGQWAGMELSEENKRMLWIPPGLAHGFLVLSESADVLYKASDYYEPKAERSVLWNDPQLGIEWPLAGEPILSAKDAAAVSFAQADVFEIAAQ